MSDLRRTSVGFRFDLFCDTDVGKEREINQDSVGEGEVPGGHLIVIADGMGGHAAGEEASRIVVESVFREFESAEASTPQHNLYVGVQQAHEAVLTYADNHGTHGMGSTAVAAFIQGNEVYLAHVGDSRLYLFRDGEVSFRTKDHTRVQRMVEAGVLSEEEAKAHPDANVVTRAVGHLPKDGDQEFAADVLVKPLEVTGADTLLMCSDGLFDLVEDREMIDLVAGTPASDAVRYLIRLANDRGGHDNISVAVVHFGAGTSRPPPLPVAQAAIPPEEQATVEAEPTAETVEAPIRRTVPETAARPDLAEAPSPPATSKVISAKRERPRPVQPPVQSRPLIDLRIVVAFLSGVVFVLLVIIAWLVFGRGPAVDPDPDGGDEVSPAGMVGAVDGVEPVMAEPVEPTPTDTPFVGVELESQPLEPVDPNALPAGAEPSPDWDPGEGSDEPTPTGDPTRLYAPEQPTPLDDPSPGAWPEEPTPE